MTCDPSLNLPQDVYKTAEAIRALGYEVTKEPGPLPGLGTKITASVDPDGWKVRVCTSKRPSQTVRCLN